MFLIMHLRSLFQIFVVYNKTFCDFCESQPFRENFLQKLMYPRVDLVNVFDRSQKISFTQISYFGQNLEL